MGCGTGFFTSQLHKQFPDAEIYGLDISKDMLDIAKQILPSATFFNINLEQDNWPVRDQKYDLIVSLFMLHHLKDVEKFLNRLRNIAADHTVIYIADFAKDTLTMKLAQYYWKLFLPSHQKSYTTKELKALLNKSGFNIDAEKILQPDLFWCQQIYRLSLSRI